MCPPLSREDSFGAGESGPGERPHQGEANGSKAECARHVRLVMAAAPRFADLASSRGYFRMGPLTAKSRSGQSGRSLDAQT